MLQKKFSAPMLICVFFSSCVGVSEEDPVTFSRIDGATDHSYNNVAATVAHNYSSSLTPNETLSVLAERLDAATVARSPMILDIRTANAELQALRAAMFPQIRPFANAPLLGDADATIAVNIDQTIWEGGRNNARMRQAEFKLMTSRLIAWRERNREVFHGLEAFVEIQRLNSRLSVTASLHQSMSQIQTLISARHQGGVSDRGETLRIDIAFRELERRLIEDRSALRNAEIDLSQDLPLDEFPVPVPLESLGRQCIRSWPELPAPDIAVANFEWMQEEQAEHQLRAQRFPRAIISSAISLTSSGISDPTLALRLDPTNMLGFERASRLDAAAATADAAEAQYVLRQAELATILSQLDEEHDVYLEQRRTLALLLDQSNDAISLFEQQLDTGAISLIDGAAIHQERAEAKWAIIDVNADLIINCLRSSALRGALAPLEFNLE